MTKRSLVQAAFLIFLACAVTSQSSAQAPNTLTPAEKAAGWRLLWDGTTTNGWRSLGKSTFPSAGWVIADGTLTKVAGVRGGDIITTEKFSDFELSWEWKLPAKANNGLKYFILEERGAIGHEYQMIDDLTLSDPYSSTASFYLVVAPRPDKALKPTGQWNSSRILVKGNHVEHWLNGVKALEYECGDPAVLEQVAKTKFKKTPDFGKKVTGHILLTDHNDECSYRNIKIREPR